MLEIRHYPPELQAHMRATAEAGLALAGIARQTEVPAVEQLNEHGDHLAVQDARQAIVATMIVGVPVELILTPSDTGNANPMPLPTV